jgi:hypothetical protein
VRRRTFFQPGPVYQGMSPSGAVDAVESNIAREAQDVASKPRLQSAGDGIKAATIISVGQHTPGMLEMEDWEVAPGVIKSSDDGATGPCNALIFRILAASRWRWLIRPIAIAFSQSFLVSMQLAEPAKITSDVSFGLKTVKASKECKFAAEPGTVVAIAVATGKVQVEIQGAELFSIGPHGVWKVKPGQECSVRNLLYGDAVLHITTIIDAG